MKKLLLVQGLVSLVLGYDTGPIRPNVQIHAERLRRQRLRRVVLDAQAILQRAVTESTETDLYSSLASSTIVLFVPIRLWSTILPGRVYLTMLARSRDVDVGTVQLSPLQARSPLLLHEDDALVAVASFIDARRDSSWHSHLLDRSVSFFRFHFNPNELWRSLSKNLYDAYLHSSGCT